MTDTTTPTLVQRRFPIKDKELGMVMFDLLEERRRAKLGPYTGASDISLAAFFEWAMSRTGTAKAQLFQDLWVLWELKELRNGYFCEFGAADGINFSNTHLLEKEYGWSGILAEPNPADHELLNRERDCHISDKCVFSESGRKMNFLCTTRPLLSRLSDVVPNDNQERRGKRQVEQEIEVESISLNDLLDSFRAPEHIDYISIDTEGSEYEILKNFDFALRSVTMFTVEHNGTAFRKDIFKLLRAHGYERCFASFSRFDDWYIRRDLISAT